MLQKTIKKTKLGLLTGRRNQLPSKTRIFIAPQLYSYIFEKGELQTLLEVIGPNRSQTYIGIGKYKKLKFLNFFLHYKKQLFSLFNESIFMKIEIHSKLILVGDRKSKDSNFHSAIEISVI